MFALLLLAACGGVMPDGSAVIALEPRETPRLRLVMNGGALLEERR